MPQLTHQQRECVEACWTCIETANACLAELVGEYNLARCLQLCLDCVELCTACVQTLQRNSQFAPRVCALLVDLCTATAQECEKFDMAECRRCAEACRSCAEACRRMA